MSQLFTSCGQKIGASASLSVLSVKIQGSFSFKLVGSPRSPRDSQESSLAPRRNLACCYCVVLFLAVYLCEPSIVPRVVSLFLLQLSLLVPSDLPFALLFPYHHLEKSLSIFPLCFSRSSSLNLSSFLSPSIGTYLFCIRFFHRNQHVDLLIHEWRKWKNLVRDPADDIKNKKLCQQRSV